MNNRLLIYTVDKLLSKPSFSSKELETFFSCTERELNQKLSDVNQLISRQGAEILENNAIYKLIIKDPNAFKEYYQSIKDMDQHIWSQEDRTSYVIEKLLLTNTFIKIEDISDELYVTPRQVSNYLKNVRDYLKKYEINVISVPHYGLKAQGDEFKRRLCLSDIYKNNLFLIDNKQENRDIQLIRSVLSECLNDNHYSLANYIFENLVVHLYVSVLRIRKDRIVSFEYVELEKQNYDLARYIAQKLGEKFEIQFPESEIQYIGIHLECKREYYKETDYAPSIPAEIWELVDVFLNTIDQKNHTSLNEDFHLRTVLAAHFMALIKRIRFGLNQDNPLLKEIRLNYVFEYELAEEGCFVINNRYNAALSEDEIGFLALDIRMSLENRYKGKQNILVVCSTGRGSAELLKAQFINSFSKYINSIRLCSVREVENMNLEEFDIIFSTVPLLIKTSKPIFKISNFLGKKDVFDIANILEFGDFTKINHFFEKNLFMGRQDFSSKEEAIRQMVEKIKEYKDIPENFYESVLERERVANTSFGNDVSFPHPAVPLTDTTFVCIAINNKPLKWTEETSVRVIILASLGKESSSDIQVFYRILTKVINSSINIEKLIKKPEYDTFHGIIFDEMN